MALGFTRFGTGTKILLGAVAALVWAALFFLPSLQNVFETLEFRAQDYQFRLRGAQPTSSLPILIVLVDDPALVPHGFRSPTPRKLLAQVLTQALAKGAACVGLDFLLDRPHLPEHDLALELALRASKGRTVVVSPAIERFSSLTSLGYSKVRVDVGGIARLMETEKKGSLDAFVSRVYRTCLGKSPPVPVARRDAPILINYYGPPSSLTDENPTFPVMSAAELPFLPAGFLRGKIVLVGSGLDDLGDVFQTAYSSSGSGFKSAFGVELHATVLGMFLEKNFLTPFPALGLFSVLLFYFAAISLGTLLLRSRLSIPGLGLWLVGWALFSTLTFAGFQVLVPMALPLFMGLLLYLVCQIVLYSTESRYANFLRGTFSRYISPELVREMENNPEMINLGGEHRELTILFSDLQGFTTLSEKLDPQGVVRLLNAHFGAMADVLLREKGTIADFIGDAVMAYFGAPIPLEDHAERACRAALGMQKEMVRLNREWKSQELPPVGMRVGVHTGGVIIGNIGSEKRQDYTVIGDPVNAASRLEGVNKFYGTGIIVSESAMAGNKGKFQVRELGRTVVKGKSEPLTIYELLGTGRSAKPQPEACYLCYQEGMTLFYGGKLGAAKRCFKKGWSEWSDPPAKFMAEYCESLPRGKASEEWKGTVLLTEK